MKWLDVTIYWRNNMTLTFKEFVEEVKEQLKLLEVDEDVKIRLIDTVIFPESHDIVVSHDGSGYITIT